MKDVAEWYRIQSSKVTSPAINSRNDKYERLVNAEYLV